MNLRLLGFCAMFGAPFLFVTYLIFGEMLDKQKTALDGLCSLLYISGWMCSVIGLWRTQVTGTNRWGRIVLAVQLLFLFLANVSNVMLLTQAGITTPLYFILDLFWPVSNLWMLATGITVVVAKRLQGAQRYVPLAVGLWLPITILLLVVFGKTQATIWANGLYSALTWTALGYIVYLMGTTESFSKAHATL
jgi:hypothetical protein